MSAVALLYGVSPTTVYRALQAFPKPPAVRFAAEHSNDCWHFDMSPSDLKHIDKPNWVDPSKGAPTLLLFRVVDDRSGFCYMEYRCVWGSH